jgi:hypothetical protein
MIRTVIVSIVSLATPIASAVAMGSGPVAATPCTTDLKAAEVATAARTLPPPAGMDSSWSPTPSGGNYNRCATLSTALITPRNVTPSSPEIALMFHHGEYVGTVPPTNLHYVAFNITQTTDDTVALDLRNDQCSVAVPAHTEYAGEDAWLGHCWGPVVTSRYKWQGDHVERL